jgi:hypothetical protein
LPAFRNRAPNLWQRHGDASYGTLELLDAAPFIPFIGFALNMEKVYDRFPTKKIPKFLAINIGLTVLGTTMCRNDQDLCGWLATLDQLDPFFDKTLL